MIDFDTENNYEMYIYTYIFFSLPSPLHLIFFYFIILLKEMHLIERDIRVTIVLQFSLIIFLSFSFRDDKRICCRAKHWISVLMFFSRVLSEDSRTGGKKCILDDGNNTIKNLFI